MGSAYVLCREDGGVLDARFEIEGDSLIVHSRGGAKGSGINADYSKSLLLLIQRLYASDIRINSAWVDSSTVQALPLAERVILFPSDDTSSPTAVVQLMSSRMKTVGRTQTDQPKARVVRGGNSTKRIRLQLARNFAEEELAERLGAKPVDGDFRSQQRLPVSELEKVTAEYIWNAVQKLLEGYADHGFGASTDYDLLAGDGTRLAPKAVFGMAASDALGFKVRPIHFAAGEGAASFRLLRSAGFAIVPKDERPPEVPSSLSESDQEWAEGKKKLVAHLVKERARGMARAKKSQFRRLHGKLYCERCHLDPVEKYGTLFAEACIEVHHNDVHVRDMSEKHRTKLDSLQCLCANCHRLVHMELRESINDPSIEIVQTGL